LGISKQAILKRYQKGQLIALARGTAKCRKVPRLAVQRPESLEGIEETLQVLNAGNRLDDFGPDAFLPLQSRISSRETAYRLPA